MPDLISISTSSSDGKNSKQETERDTATNKKLQPQKSVTAPQKDLLASSLWVRNITTATKAADLKVRVLTEARNQNKIMLNLNPHKASLITEKKRIRINTIVICDTCISVGELRKVEPLVTGLCTRHLHTIKNPF
jgi:hypothetical protein